METFPSNIKWAIIKNIIHLTYHFTDCVFRILCVILLFQIYDELFGEEKYHVETCTHLQSKILLYVLSSQFALGMGTTALTFIGTYLS